MKRSNLVLVTTIIILFSDIALSQVVEFVDDSTLLGLKALIIESVSLDKRTEKSCVTSAEIEKDLELKLRLAGINIYSAPFANKTDSLECLDLGVPILSIKILSIYNDQYDAVFYINLSLLELAEFVREPNNWGHAKRWETHGLIVLGEKNFFHLRGYISDLMDQFIVEYLKVNPK